MSTLTGMEKFSHLEDKIYRMVEYAKTMREENERLKREAGELRQSASETAGERNRIEENLATLMSERDSIQLKVEAMLDAITQIDTDVAEAVGRG